MTPSETPEGFTFVDKRGRDREASEPSEQKGEPRTQPAGRPSEAAGDVFGAPPGPADLSSVVIMLASSAFIQLGERPDSADPEIPPDLNQAQYIIDLLSVLQDKTAGNRTPEESQLLETVLYDLRMRFVRKARRR